MIVNWQGRSGLNRESRFWRPMVCRLAYIPEETLVHVVGLAPTKDSEVRLIYSQVPLLLSHTCDMNFGFQISIMRFQIQHPLC